MLTKAFKFKNKILNCEASLNNIQGNYDYCSIKNKVLGLVIIWIQEVEAIKKNVFPSTNISNKISMNKKSKR